MRGSGNGVDVARFADDGCRRGVRLARELGLPVDAIVVGFVGRFTSDKGIADLIGVFTSTLRDHDAVHLLLVGRSRMAIRCRRTSATSSSPTSGS